MKLDVVGGTYRENCNEGEWHQLFGSGLRAAAALRGEMEIEFHTCLGEPDLPLFETVASTFRFATDVHFTAQTISFSYDHGLSTPLIYPPQHTIGSPLQFRVAAANVLRFGMIEGDPVVNAEMAVYDPQAAFLPEYFGKNGSTAKRLVVVCNRREAKLLTGEGDLGTAAAAIRKLDGAEAVVIKCGSHGALLVSDSGTEWIPAFETNDVWPIGSGDVYAAAFCAAWTKGASHKESAIIASRATAYYCETRSLPLPSLTDGLPDLTSLKLRSAKDSGKKPLVYLAGPFFNMGQRWLVHESRAALLEQGMDVFSPFHDVGFGVAAEVVPADLEGIRRADLMLALLDHLDSGTLFEVGYARSLGKPVVGFCQSTPDEALKMLVGSECTIVTNFVTAIYRTAWTALRDE